MCKFVYGTFLKPYHNIGYTGENFKIWANLKWCQKASSAQGVKKVWVQNYFESTGKIVQNSASSFCIPCSLNECFHLDTISATVMNSSHSVIFLQVQHEVQLQRQREKKQLMESVKQFKKGICILQFNSTTINIILGQNKKQVCFPQQVEKLICEKRFFSFIFLSSFAQVLK